MSGPVPTRHIANALTVARAVLGPFVFLLVMAAMTAPTGAATLLIIALILALIAEATDLADGWAARRFNAVSELGATLDPLADALYRLTVFAAFAAAGMMPAWLIIVFIWRDLTVAYVRTVAARRGDSVAARLSGKAKAVVQGVAQVAILALFAAHAAGAVGDPSGVAALLAFAAAAVTAWSLVDYAGGFLAPAPLPAPALVPRTGASVFAEPEAQRRIIHHRALNTAAAAEAADAMMRDAPDARHALEADICWLIAPDREALYCRHPSVVFDSLDAEALDRALADGSVLSLEAALDRLPATAEIVCELKTGRGDVDHALALLVEALDTHAPGRWWIDSFSTDLLQRVRALAPHASLTLHTERIVNGQAVTASPQDPRVRFQRLEDLTWLDGVSVRWWGGWPRMKRSLDAVEAAGLTPLVSRLLDVPRVVLFGESRAWGGYVDATDDTALRAAVRHAAATRRGEHAPTAP